MKRHRLYYAIFAMAMATIASVVAVSCKKETSSDLLNNKNESAQSFSPPQVDDMNAYLKGFKQKMKDSSQDTRDGETLSLEEAAWHLSSVANYDFGHANVEFTDLRYDTLRYQVNVTNGQVALADLNAVYQRVASDIDDFYQSLNLENKHIRFVGASISNSGEVVVTLITSYTWMDHVWYFGDIFEAMDVCDSVFCEDSVYVWNALGASELNRIINEMEGREYAEPDMQSLSRVYFVSLMQVVFDFWDNIDPYGSPFKNNSRIYAKDDDSYAIPEITLDEMCYCLDSYLNLGFDYVEDHNFSGNCRPVHWFVEGKSRIFPPNHWPTFYHEVTVVIGQLIESGEIPPQG